MSMSYYKNFVCSNEHASKTRYSFIDKTNVDEMIAEHLTKNSNIKPSMLDFTDYFSF